MEASPLHPTRSAARVPRRAASLFGALLVSLAAPVAARAAVAAAPDTSGALIRFAPGTSPGERAALLRRHGAIVRERLTTPGVIRVAPTPGTTLGEALTGLRSEPATDWAEPIRLYRASAVPNDPAFGAQWGLRNVGQTVGGEGGTAGDDVDAVAAWDTTVGSPSTVVAVVDGGVDLSHPDLAPNLPPNPGESGGGRETNGVDDDGNGFIDDVRGWDFVADDNDPQDQDTASHGSHVAGILAARGGNGIGVSGLSQQASLLPIRALTSNGTGTSADIAAAFSYAASRGARVVNASLGGPAPSAAIETAIREAPNTLFVVAAGNEGRDLDTAQAEFPCAFPAPNLICVTASDQSDAIPSFANVGAQSVDLAAPGVNIFSTVRGGGYGLLDGTSMSSPLVAGAAALLLGRDRGLSSAQVAGAILKGVDPVPGMAGLTRTGGRLDAARSLASVPPAGPAPVAETGAADSVADTTARVAGTVRPGGMPTSYHFEYGPGPGYGSRTTERFVGAGTGPLAVAATLSGLAPRTTYHFRLVAATVDGLGNGADGIFTTGPASPAGARPLGGASAARLARSLKVRRVGRAWFGSLTLPDFSVVSGHLERRKARHGRRVAFSSTLGIRRRGLAAGVRRVPLGRLRPGAYRLRVKLRDATGVSVLTRRFTVPVTPPRPRRAR
jgi:subtilisin family serine protease